MLKTPRRIAALVLIMICIFSLTSAEDTIDITIAHNERWTVPSDRLGDCSISDESVLALEDGQLVGLKPGRAEARFSGKQPTTYRVLVLFAEAAQAEDASPAEQHTSDFRLYTFSDGDEEDDSSAAPITEPSEDTDEDETASDLPDPEDETLVDEDASADQPESETEEPSADASDDAETVRGQLLDTEADFSDDITVQSYDRSEVPEAINTVIDFAISEWRTAENKTFSRLGSKNKYSFWQCGKGPKCNIGWCGAFLGYVFDTCGISMDEPNQSVPHESGEPYSVRAAGVGKINKGFDKMGRLTMVPRPGYLVVYGEQKAYGYKHIGLVTDVDDLGGGIYLLKTVEGNMSNRIKRFCYLFDSNESIKNTRPCPEEYRLTDGEINDYEHIKKWNITTFCQTWF